MARKSKSQYCDTIELRAVCPTCGGSEIDNDLGTQKMPGYDYHARGEYLGRLIAVRRVVCKCGQRYRIKVVKPPAKVAEK